VDVHGLPSLSGAEYQFALLRSFVSRLDLTNESAYNATMLNLDSEGLRLTAENTGDLSSDSRTGERTRFVHDHVFPVAIAAQLPTSADILQRNSSS
jgi:hypothetical protein